MKKKAKRIRREFTPDELEAWKKKRDQVEREDVPRLMSLGKEFLKNHNETVAKVLEELRLAKDEGGLTYAQIAEKTGISEPSLARLFTAGENPTLLTLGKVASALSRKLEVTLTK